MNELYPIKFKPVFKEKIWGGQKIRTVLGLDFRPLANCGEAWVVSGVKGSESKIANGFLKGNLLNDILEIYMDDLVGEYSFNKHGRDFPVLVKFIDSNDYLSVQVHPDDSLAARRKIGSGKSEMWYILDAEPDAELYTGFNRDVTPDIYIEHLRNKKLRDILHVEKVKKGDVFYIPAGRIHALGPGILLAEIQQTSDTTYRIYDWDRVDENGKSRELHTDLALEAIDFARVSHPKNEYTTTINNLLTIADTPWFTTNLFEFDQVFERDLTLLDSFVIHICVEGSATIRYNDGHEPLKMGEAALIPAMMDNIVLEPSGTCRILEVFVQ